MDSSLLLKSLEKALGQLSDALVSPVKGNLEKAGCIQYFEFCFELTWKSIKVIVENQGISDCASPKAALKRAFALHWIDREELWLEMLSARNRMSHTYNADEALKIYDRLRDYEQAMGKLLSIMKTQEE